MVPSCEKDKHRKKEKEECEIKRSEERRSAKRERVISKIHEEKLTSWFYDI